jgi:hypothetical protein
LEDSLPNNYNGVPVKPERKSIQLKVQSLAVTETNELTHALHFVISKIIFLIGQGKLIKGKKKVKVKLLPYRLWRLRLFKEQKIRHFRG